MEATRKVEGRQEPDLEARVRSGLKRMLLSKDGSAAGYMDMLPERLLAAIDAAPLVDERELDAGRVSLRPRKQRPLSARELEVLTAVSHGGTDAQIAKQLGVSKSTVKSHLKRIYRCLRAAGRAHAVGIGLRKGLIS